MLVEVQPYVRCCHWPLKQSAFYPFDVQYELFEGYFRYVVPVYVGEWLVTIAAKFEALLKSI